MPANLAAEFDALIEQAASLTDQEQRRAIYEQLQTMAQEMGVNVWIHQQ
jgi:ABC-type transport system substrate-binding protein